jgi:hypothetical protein
LLPAQTCRPGCSTPCCRMKQHGSLGPAALHLQDAQGTGKASAGGRKLLCQVAGSVMPALHGGAFPSLLPAGTTCRLACCSDPLTVC